MTATDRWRTGWVILGRAHRPDPDHKALTMCGLPLVADAQVLVERPQDVAECGKCCMMIGRARKKARGATQVKLKYVDPEAADRADRARHASTSIRTVRGGLPGLGSRQWRS